MTDYSDPSYRAARLKKRYQAERRFRAYGVAAIATVGLILTLLLGSIVYTSMPAFTHHYVTLDIDLSADYIDADDVVASNWRGAVRGGLRDAFPKLPNAAISANCIVYCRLARPMMCGILSCAIPA